ncbi:uncharacterized protein [Lepisosteus oculatus]|uniref:uncharacterized protein isoform X1 n=1 Tax=Lepisosteus oculatus TaxID=7918 RepID=UPI0035F514D0
MTGACIFEIAFSQLKYKMKLIAVQTQGIVVKLNIQHVSTCPFSAHSEVHSLQPGASLSLPLHTAGPVEVLFDPAGSVQSRIVLLSSAGLPGPRRKRRWRQLLRQERGRRTPAGGGPITTSCETEEKKEALVHLFEVPELHVGGDRRSGQADGGGGDRSSGEEERGRGGAGCREGQEEEEEVQVPFLVLCLLRSGLDCAGPELRGPRLCWTEAEGP